jgi:hypothetical protein
VEGGRKTGAVLYGHKTWDIISLLQSSGSQSCSQIAYEAGPEKIEGKLIGEEFRGRSPTTLSETGVTRE